MRQQKLRLPIPYFLLTIVAEQSAIFLVDLPPHKLLQWLQTGAAGVCTTINFGLYFKQVSHIAGLVQHGLAAYELGIEGLLLTAPHQSLIVRQALISDVSSSNMNSTINSVYSNKDWLAQYLPNSVSGLENLQTSIPQIAKDKSLLESIAFSVEQIPTSHTLWNADSRNLSFIADNSVHLVVTSPPYWTLKKYHPNVAQLGEIKDYEEFLTELDKVWQHCYRLLVPGGRLVCVVGDVCLSRRRNKGRHVVYPLHASIQEHCRKIGFDNLTPILWHKIANANFEASGNGAGFLGKPYEPNAVIKNDVEFILMERKPGGYRKPTPSARILSIISDENHKSWFQAIWSGLTGASTKQHPAPYPKELAERLIRMFSFVGDTVLDPFLGTGTTSIAAARWGRNSIGVEIDPQYFATAQRRLINATSSLFSKAEIEVANLVDED